MLLLIVDDDAGVREALKETLQDHHQVILRENGLEALKELEKTAIELVITDNQMPKLTGLELIRRGREISPGTSFLLMTAFGSVEDAVEAIRIGADDYFLKPFETTEIHHRIRRIEELASLRRESQLRQENQHGTTKILGRSPAIQRALAFISQVAPATSPVLLLGPSGTGKEVMAKAVHEAGPRAMRPFVAINCASLNEQLLESELFGHEKGAFTGATHAKPGKFELARGGTLFLDEAGELSPAIQARLLRVLQEQEFFRVGGVRQVKTDARVIAATHRPLKEMVKAGTFREDLYFRLNVLTFELPPLAARGEDVPVLIDAFWKRLTQESGGKPHLAPETLELLVRYSYPGNIRELQNVLERLAVLGRNRESIGPELLPPEFGDAPVERALPHLAPSAPEEGLTDALERFELQLLKAAMEKAAGNQVRAAALLKITRGALQYKLKKYHLTSESADREAA